MSFEQLYFLLIISTSIISTCGLWFLKLYRVFLNISKTFSNYLYNLFDCILYESINITEEFLGEHLFY